MSNDRNNYEGNGWSKYQIMVLQQLEDHSEVLQNINREIVDIKQTMAVSETELKMWRTSAMSDLETLEKQMDIILYEDDGLSGRIDRLEMNEEFKNRIAIKNKALWAGLGAGAACVLDLIIKLATYFSSLH